MKKRILSFVLAVAVALSLAAAVPAYGAETESLPVYAASQEDNTLGDEPSGENDPVKEMEEPDTQPEQPPIEQMPQEISGVEERYTFAAETEGAKLEAVTSGDGLIQYYSNKPEVVEVDQYTGQLTFGKAGTANILLIAEESPLYRSAEKTIQITVTKLPQTISGLKDAMEVKYKSNGTFQLGAETDGDGTLTYASSNNSIAEVDQSTGKVTMKKIGTVTITATAAETLRCSKATKKIEVTIYKSPVALKASSYYKKSKYYKKLMALKLSGSNRANLVAIANSQIGYHEGNSASQMGGTSKGSGNYTEYGYVYGLQGAWCAMFISWCARENGTATSVIPKYCAVMSYRGYYEKKKLYYTWAKTTGGSGSYTPKAGDLLFYSTVYGRDTQHIGYVKSCKLTSTKITITTIEGNTSDEVRSRTFTVKRKSNGKIGTNYYIHGFASPKY